MALPEQRRLPGWIEPLILLVLAAALLWPMFQMRFPDHWNWDDGTRIADAHFLREHWPRPGWQPYWFAGISFDSIYPPLIRYAVAGLARGAVRVASPESTARAYWLVIGFALVLGTLGAWRLAAILTGSRWAAAWAGLMLLCVSPGLIFLPAVRADVLAPFRIHVAARYGGGPHAVGLSLMLWALIFTWQALRGGSVRRMILAGAAWAATLAADFPATFTGAILLSLIIWGDWIERRRRRTWIIAAVLPAIALTLNSWWLTPGRLVGALAIMWRNATASSLWAPWLAVGLLLTILVWSERNWAGRAGAAVKTVSLGGALYILFDVTAGVHTQFRLGVSATRYLPELDLLLVLCASLFLLWLWRTAAWGKPVAVLLALLPLAAAVPYLRGPYRVFPQRVTSGPDDPRRAASEWLRANLPDRRIFLAGRVESWNLLWGGAFQPGGGLDPGDVQRTLGVFALRAYESTSAGYIEKWMRALAIDAVMLPAGDNFDEFGNLKGAAQFRETFRLLHEHSAGFAVYRIPRRQPGLARIVRVGELQPSPPLDLVNREADLDRFVAAVERGPDATAKVVFRNNNEFEVTGRLEKGEAYWIAMRHDDGWDAYCGDKQVNINVDAAGFMSIEAPPGEQRVRLYYRGTWPQRFGLLLTVLCGFGMFWAGVRNRLGAWS